MNDGMRLVLVLAIASGGAIASTAARAANGNKPRTPPDFGEVPCMTIVDRSIDPVFHLEWTIENEDVELTKDEVEDSRTHQFFAFTEPRYALPWWISDADVQAAAALDLVDPTTLGEADVMDTSSDLASFDWTRINGDDERIPITFEAASEGLDWDTSGLAAGAWEIRGYVWEPPVNQWTRRNGIIKVVDDADPSSSPPAAWIRRTPGLIVDAGESATLSACVDAMAGSTMTVEWAEFGYDDLDWHEALPPQTIATGDVELVVQAPGCTEGGPIVYRVTVTDPQGRSDSTETPDVIVVLADQSGAACEAEQAEDSEATHGCRSTRPAPCMAMFVFLAVAAVGRRRRINPPVRRPLHLRSGRSCGRC
jgi:hypothetical protein